MNSPYNYEETMENMFGFSTATYYGGLVVVLQQIMGVWLLYCNKL